MILCNLENLFKFKLSKFIVLLWKLSLFHFVFHGEKKAILFGMAWRWWVKVETFIFLAMASLHWQEQHRQVKYVKAEHDAHKCTFKK